MGKATRDAYGETLKRLGSTHPDIVVLDADLSESTKKHPYLQKNFLIDFLIQVLPKKI